MLAKNGHGNISSNESGEAGGRIEYSTAEMGETSLLQSGKVKH